MAVVKPDKLTAETETWLNDWDAIVAHTHGFASIDCHDCERIRRYRDVAKLIQGLRARVIETEKQRVEERDARQKAEHRLRQEWWCGHGCLPSDLYGDDGEMQCSACGGIDFLRMPLDNLQRWVEDHRLARVLTALKTDREGKGPL